MSAARVVIVTLFASNVLGGSILAADICKGPGVVESQYSQHQSTLDRSDALVVSIIQGVFTDLGPTWRAALGYSDLIYDPEGVYPDLSPYSILLVDTSDMWWTYSFAADEAVWTSFHDGGRCVFVIGQDYLYARGDVTGFPQTVLGLSEVRQDVAMNSWIIDWSGTPGGMLDGTSGSVLACFAGNGFYTDDVTPRIWGMAEWTDELGASGQAGCTASQAGLSTLEFGCGGDVGVVAESIRAQCACCPPPVPVMPATWGRVKQSFR
jgi:hypothetical protein